MKSIFARSIFFIACLLYAGAFLHAQTKEELRYRKESDEMRKEVWAWDMPEFRKKDIPAEYTKASKVIIAHHTELTADSKSKLSFVGFGLGSKKESSITEVVREMIKLNDKSSVDYYSEFSFTRLEKRSGFFSNAKSTSFVGVRIIKPDGNVKEINADDIVLTKDASNEKKAKLAIPDLQPGDIIDYFIATDQVLTNDFSVKSYNVILFDEAPVLHYSFHGQLGKKFAIDYRSYNGAPDLKVSKNDDKDLVIDVAKKNMPPFETSLWVAPALQLPLIRMNISLGFRGPGRKFMGMSKPGEVSKNKETDEVVELQANEFASKFYASYFMKANRKEFDDIVSDAKKKAKQLGLSYKGMNDDEKAAFLFYTLRFSKLLDFNIDQLERSINSGDYIFNGLAFILNCTLKAGDLEPAVLVSSSRTGYRMNEVMDLDDLNTAAYLLGNNKILSIESIYDLPFTIPSSIEGVKNTRSITFRNRGAVMSLNAINKMAEVGPGIKVPETDASKNAHIDQLIISVDPGQNKLAVKRKTTVKGHTKYSLQRKLILYEDYYEAERKAMGEEMSLLESLEDKKKSRRYVDEVRNAFAEARGKQKDAFADEAKEWFEQDVTDLKDEKVDNLGVRHTAPDFVYSSSFNLDGLLKKAGNNLILEIGKIQGQPLSIKPDQRKRDLDVYMPYARSIEYDIALKIPEGYTVEGLDALNKKVENKTGFFVAEASANGETVRIKVKKHYLHNYEPAANWEMMTQFLDAASDWTNAKLLLKKK